MQMSKLAILAKLADELDMKGLPQEANQLDNIIQDIVVEEKAEKVEKEKKERTTSKKVMKKFKRLKEAAESVCEGDVDTRGPYRELFDKARFEAQEICTLLKDIVFTEEGEKEANESGQIQENIAAAESVENKENLPVAAPVAVEQPIMSTPAPVAVPVAAEAPVFTL